MALKRDIKAAVKAFLAAPSAKTLAAAQSELDTAVKKNLIPKQRAARRKSQLSRVAKDAGVKLETTKKTPAKKPAATKSTAKTSTKSATTAKAPAKKPAAKKTAAKKPAAKKPAAKKASK